MIRTGYGMFYLPVDLRWDDAPHNLFINSITNPWLVAQSDGVTPKATLSNPFPGGVTEPLQRNQSAIDVQGVGNSAAPPFTKSPYMQQWNLDVQRQFKGDLLLDVAYAASKGTNLPMHSQDIDQLQAQNLPQNAAGRGKSDKPWSAIRLPAIAPGAPARCNPVISGPMRRQR